MELGPKRKVSICAEVAFGLLLEAPIEDGLRGHQPFSWYASG